MPVGEPRSGPLRRRGHCGETSWAAAMLRPPPGFGSTGTPGEPVSPSVVCA
jgi:hypothetical protein